MLFRFRTAGGVGTQAVIPRVAEGRLLLMPETLKGIRWPHINQSFKFICSGLGLK